MDNGVFGTGVGQMCEKHREEYERVYDSLTETKPVNVDPARLLQVSKRYRS